MTSWQPPHHSLVNPWIGPNYGYYGCPENPMVEGQLPLTSSGADQEPTLVVKLEGRPTPMVVDTGATYICVEETHTTDLPRSVNLPKQ